MTSSMALSKTKKDTTEGELIKGIKEPTTTLNCLIMEE